MAVAYGSKILIHNPGAIPENELMSATVLSVLDAGTGKVSAVRIRATPGNAPYYSTQVIESLPGTGSTQYELAVPAS